MPLSASTVRPSEREFLFVGFQNEDPEGAAQWFGHIYRLTPLSLPRERLDVIVLTE